MKLDLVAVFFPVGMRRVGCKVSFLVLFATVKAPVAVVEGEGPCVLIILR